MKKVFTLLFAVMAACFNASAEDWDIVLNVASGADRVKAVVGESEYSDNVVTLKEGENQIHIPEWESLYIIPLNETDVVSLTDSEGDPVEASYGYFEIYASPYRDPYSPYTLTVTDEASYRTHSVSVNIDDPSKVTIVRADGKTFEPETGTIDIPYNAENESELIIKPRSYDGLIYKVSAGGTDVPSEGGRFKVNLVDNSGSEPAYVETVDVQVNFPEGLTYTTTIALDGPAEMISYIRVNGTDVADMADCLDADGFEAEPGDAIAIGFNSDYKIDLVKDNGEEKYAYSQLTIEQITCDHKVEITGHKYATFNVKFNVTGAEGVVASLGSTQLSFVEGESSPEFSERNSNVTFSPAEGWYFETFTNAKDEDLLDSSDWRYYNKVYLNVSEGDEYTIVAKKIVRDDRMVLYLGGMEGLDFSYFSAKFQNYDSFQNALGEGYNVVNFRPEDGAFSMYASGSYDGFYAYKNGAYIEPSYEGAKYFEDAEVGNGTVYKVFFVNEPAVYDVTFDIAAGALEGYEVKQDVLADVDCSAPVKAVGKTRFTISPKTEEAEALQILVNDQPVEAVDGVYTFDTESASTVSILTTGVAHIAADTPGAKEVYTLQGVRVNAGSRKLPAGVYVVGGKKVVVK